ncbi:hypothetical protein SODALDRAFT_356815 [Sodiomyces alkalinus F11]|uniref:Uncharacterized protein n=1 Tax=Sodiomyces alkalinus (strain CBS 110278 / VKM F-3762 / F11) TaxID=1314773 RepID=A0A3N2Q2A0_SODAK|nr:hypothetical protein SODALDRAFT_356815 [Sodiomyces alkalinus F11]ROT40798.1 hypothetical protein SODALDRAFT_356815 [Sodiomyces alkalinus F11]
MKGRKARQRKTKHDHHFVRPIWTKCHPATCLSWVFCHPSSVAFCAVRPSIPPEDVIKLREHSPFQNHCNVPGTRASSLSQPLVIQCIEKLDPVWQDVVAAACCRMLIHHPWTYRTSHDVSWWLAGICRRSEKNARQQPLPTL